MSDIDEKVERLVRIKSTAVLYFFKKLSNGPWTLKSLYAKFLDECSSEETRKIVGTTEKQVSSFLLAHPTIFMVEGETVSVNEFSSFPNADSANGCNSFSKETVNSLIEILQNGPLPLRDLTTRFKEEGMTPEILQILCHGSLKAQTKFVIAYPLAFMTFEDNLWVQGIETDIEKAWEANTPEGNKNDNFRKCTLFSLHRICKTDDWQPIRGVFQQLSAESAVRKISKIVAGSHKTLDSFLSDYPSVFEVKNDFVYLKKNTGGEVSEFSEKNYQYFVTQTIQFFSDRVKAEPKTLENLLACLRCNAFSSDVRKILVKGSARALQELFRQYPSHFFLFAHGDEVFVARKDDLEFPIFTYDPESYFEKDILEYYHEILELVPHSVQDLVEFLDDEDIIGDIRSVINGGSTEDLAKMLSKYPKHFKVIDGLVMSDKMYRSSVLEAVAYFKGKLPPDGCEGVNLTSLHGHRAQADINIRLVIGKSVDDLHNFLRKFPNVFSPFIASFRIYFKLNCNPEQRPVPQPPTQLVPLPNRSIKHMIKSIIINSVEEGARVVEKLLKQSVLAVDLEGVNLGANGRITLIQVATMASEIFIFDVLMMPKLVSDTKLLDIFTSPSCIKVIHDCRSDAACLFTQYGIKIKNIFDTQTAHVVLQAQRHRVHYSTVNGFIGLNQICEAYGLPGNPFKDNMKDVYKTDYAFWSRRPLNEEMILYAAADVLCLVPNLYAYFERELSPENMRLLKELSVSRLTQKLPNGYQNGGIECMSISLGRLSVSNVEPPLPLKYTCVVM